MTRARKKSVKRNPVPPSVRLQVKQAEGLFADFTGHDGNLVSVQKPTIPNVMLVVGQCDGIMYTTIRDGKTEKYLHQFKKSSRPLLCSSSDGKSLYLLGGAYDFTDRGIVDHDPA